MGKSRHKGLWNYQHRNSMLNSCIYSGKLYHSRKFEDFHSNEPHNIEMLAQQTLLNKLAGIF